VPTFRASATPVFAAASLSPPDPQATNGIFTPLLRVTVGTAAVRADATPTQARAAKVDSARDIA
jgi:hypothetical protein